MTETLTLTIPAGETWAFAAPIEAEILDRDGIVFGEVSKGASPEPLYLKGIAGYTVRVPANAVWWEVNVAQ